MADKIVILEDSEGNNIYPISRGLATNSVDTNAIQNGAVTSAKIDWTNYTSSNAIVGTNGTSISGNRYVIRLGNIVFLSGILQTDSMTRSFTGQIVPVDGRPANTMNVPVVAYQSGSGSQTVRLAGRMLINSDGSFTVTLAEGVTANQFIITGTYTNI